ncbi:PREDICTED: putative defensin-like protein 191 [Camelina sativa]|uniref:Defensin-like protein 191 n=1 Tax=Camelina sativa TaxID=90675 RepID=A0ABM1QGJ3_CAMSA|nr:PREDICTED: putative defensin-like protein 191 [Camelina sativa]
MAKGVHAIGFITYLVIFLILTVGISRVKTQQPPCNEGRVAYVSPDFCIDSICTQDCTLAGVYSSGKCEIERSKPVCKCYGCK